MGPGCTLLYQAHMIDGRFYININPIANQRLSLDNISKCKLIVIDFKLCIKSQPKILHKNTKSFIIFCIAAFATWLNFNLCNTVVYEELPTKYTCIF